MKVTQKLKMMLRALLMKAGEIDTDKGKLIYEGELEVGTEVFIEKAEGEEVEVVEAPDGSYVENDGDRIIDVEGGRVKEIREKENEQPQEEETPETPETPADPDPTPDPDQPVEGEEEPAADPADENDEEEAETVEERVARLEARLSEFTEGLEAILNGIANLEQRLEAVEAKVANLEEPGADPAEQGEEFNETPKSRLAYLRKK